MSSKLIVDTIEDSTGTYSLALGSGNSTFPGGIHIGGTGSANLLDDYEEGTFTPTLGASTTDPSVTYTKQTGNYTKVGNLVIVGIDLRWSAQSGGSGNTRVQGLPFASDGANYYGGAIFEHSSSFGYGTGYSTLTFEHNVGNTIATLLKSGTGVGTAGVAISGVGTSAGYLIFSYSYRSA